MELTFRIDELVVEEIPGDMYTPISIFKLLQGNNKFLLESSLKHTDAGRYSYIGVNPSFSLLGYESNCEIIFQDDKRKVINEHPLDYLNEIFLKSRSQVEKIPFISGCVGYIGYDAMKQFYKIPSNKHNKLKVPDIHLMFYEVVIVYDHLKQIIFITALPLLKSTTKQSLKKQIQNIVTELTANRQYENNEEFTITNFKQNINREEYVSNVKNTLKLISEADLSQVVLSQRLSASFQGDPFAFYRKLRLANPSPYMFYIDFNDYVITGSSPESVVKVTNNKIFTNPIAGTRPRGKTEAQDKKFAEDLLNDTKEVAEHKMLVQLSEQELKKICPESSIRLEQSMEIEKYQHVMHLVSILSGELDKNLNTIDAIKACLPAGTVSGSPKKKAMQIINKYEAEKRGVYGGAVGYISINGNCNLSLAIRMAIFKDNHAYVQAGAGIVKGSNPQLEYEETLLKLKALLNLK